MSTTKEQMKGLSPVVVAYGCTGCAECGLVYQIGVWAEPCDKCPLRYRNAYAKKAAEWDYYWCQSDFAAADSWDGED